MPVGFGEEVIPFFIKRILYIPLKIEWWFLWESSEKEYKDNL
jgi:hypothetical protein